VPAFPAAASAAYYAQHPVPRGRTCFAQRSAGIKLGLGGGALQMLIHGWRATGAGCPFEEWLELSRKLIVLAGGRAAACPPTPRGQALHPHSALQGSFGQRLDQTLLDLQLEAYRGVLERAPRSSRVMVTSGDVLLRFDPSCPRSPRPTC